MNGVPPLAAMSPFAWEDWYHHIKIGYCYGDAIDHSQVFEVDIRKYLMGLSSQNEGWTVASQAKEQLRKKKIPNAYVDEEAIRAAYTGKGSPSDLNHALECAVLAGQVERERDAMQKYADKWLGVDCSGLVSSYLVHVGAIPKPKWYLPAYVKPDLSNLRRSLDDVQPADIVIWYDVRNRAEVKGTQGVGHVVLIAAVMGNMLFTVESRGQQGSGPEDTRFTDVSVDGAGQWSAKRSSPPGSGASKVAILKPF